MIRIEPGWNFNSADFSVQANGNPNTKGTVLLVRSQPSKERWHHMPYYLQEDDDGPPLYVSGTGMTLEEAITNANLAAAHAKPIPTTEDL